jgi:hypothetical protein
MGRRQVLYEPDEPITHVYFPTTAVVSLLVLTEDGSSVDAALVGNDGVVGAAFGGEPEGVVRTDDPWTSDRITPEWARSVGLAFVHQDLLDARVVVLGGAGAKAVALERIAAGHQLEVLVRNHDVQEAGPPADRAIAVERRYRRVGHSRGESNRAAVAAAGYGDHDRRLGRRARPDKVKGAGERECRRPSGERAS